MAFSRVIVSSDAQQRVEVGSESSLHNGGSVRVANKDVAGERAVTLPFVDGWFEGREGGLPDPRRVRPGDVGDESAFRTSR